MQAIGLGLLADEVDAGTTSETIKDRLYARPDWLWGGMPDWTNPRVEINAALRDIGQAGVVRAFSAFDLFRDELMAELISWRDFSGATPYDAASTQTNNDEPGEADRIERIYARLGASRARISDVWAVYVYFRRARNCIAHREGVASRSLVEAYDAPRWRRRSNDGLRGPVT